MAKKPWEDGLHLGFCVALALGTGLVFWLPPLRAAGEWPAPLDDVFIHYDFARALARGAPFHWIAGQGYSSGETSPLYALVLGAGYLVGFRGLWLGVWAAMVAVVSLASLMRAARELVRPAPLYVSWLAATFFVAIGLVDWSWFSGMEVALFGGLLGRTLVLTKRALAAAPTERARAQTWLGLAGMALVATRPEAVVIVLVLGTLVARGSRSGSAIFALARVESPAALFTLALALVNLVFTGDARSAGAILKLLSSNPFLTDEARAFELLQNLGAFAVRLATQLSPVGWGIALFPALAVFGLYARRTRALTLTCLASALLFTLVVSWNGAARYQNFRYYVPPLALFLVAAALGLGAVARARKMRPLALAWGIAATAAAAFGIAGQAAHFAKASRNIRDQQVEVGRRLARTSAQDAIVLVGDAGAIPYVAERHAIDALGLGGYGKFPFARAATHGEGAIAELLQRMPARARPTILALYPNWFSRMTALFGHEIDRVTITDNVICGGPTKGIYAADWKPLDADATPLDAVDELDVADIVSEEAHGYVSPAPAGGWTVAEVQGGVFDGGRIVPEGGEERFTVPRGIAAGALSLRIGGANALVSIAVHRGIDLVHVTRKRLPSASLADWSRVDVRIPGGIREGDRVVLRAEEGEHRTYHVWLLRGE